MSLKRKTWNSSVWTGRKTCFWRDRSFNKRIILVIDQKVPEYDKDAGSVRMYEYLKIFVEMGAKVIFADNLYPTELHTSELQNLGIVIYGIRRLKKYIKTYGRL